MVSGGLVGENFGFIGRSAADVSIEAVSGGVGGASGVKLRPNLRVRS